MSFLEVPAAYSRHFTFGPSAHPDAYYGLG